VVKKVLKKGKYNKILTITLTITITKDEDNLFIFFDPVAVSITFNNIER
jgi:hypothetical protein